MELKAKITGLDSCPVCGSLRIKLHETYGVQTGDGSKGYHYSIGYECGLSIQLNTRKPNEYHLVANCPNTLPKVLDGKFEFELCETFEEDIYEEK